MVPSQCVVDPTSLRNSPSRAAIPSWLKPCPIRSPGAKNQEALPPGYPAPACLGTQMPCPEHSSPRPSPAFPTGNLTAQGRAGQVEEAEDCLEKSSTSLFEL